MHQMDRLTLPAHVLATILLGAIVMTCAYAHSPHDVITSVAISPYYEKDQTVFIYVFDELKKSSDGGYSWKNLERGLDNNAAISDILTSPRNHSEYDTFVATRGDGIYRSNDRGISWRAVNVGLSNLNIRHLIASPDFSSDGTLVAVPKGAGLFISTNTGDSWEYISSDKFYITSLSIVKIDGGIKLLAGTDNGEIYLSDHAFSHWFKQGEITGAGMITSLCSQKAGNPGPLVFVGTESEGLYKTTDLGKSYSHIEINTELTESEKTAYVTSIAAVERTEGATGVFVTLWDKSAFFSTNGGKSWELLDKGLKKNIQADEHNKPHFSEIVVPAEYIIHGEAFIAGFSGLFKTSDSAQTWIELETRPVRNIEGIAVSPYFSDDQLVALASYDGGAYISTNSGKTWEANNIGLMNTHLWDVAIAGDSGNELNIFLVSNLSFLTSQDISSAWSRNEIAASTYWRFVSDNFDEGSIAMKLARRLLDRPDFTFATQIAVSPDFQRDKTVFLGTRYRGVLKSTDAGSTWTHPWQEGKTWVPSLKVSPNYRADGIIVASARRKGFYLSSDSGRTWQSRNKGLSSQAIQYQNLGTSVLAFSPAFGEDSRLFFGTADGLYLTTSNGQNWERLSITGRKQREHIRAIGISPDFSNDATILVSVKGLGLFKSTDKGRSFSEVAPDLIHSNQLLKLIRFSPGYSRDHMIFAASSEEVFVSNNSGISWIRLDRPVRYENTKDNLIYSKGWKKTSHNAFSALNIYSSNIPGAKVDFYFVGKQVTWYGPMSEGYGMANIYLDGELVGTADQFNSETRSFAPVYTVDGLSFGPHILTIEVLDKKNRNASDHFIAIDALDVL